MSGRFTIDCRICGDSLSTGDAEQVLAFDRRHTASCPTLSPVSPAPVTPRAADEHDDRPAVNRATPAAGRSSSGGAQ